MNLTFLQQNVNVILTTMLLALIILLCYNHHRRSKKLSQLENQIERSKKQAVDTSRRVLKGQIAEQLLPLMCDCPYLPSDMRFIGNPVDYIVIDGYTDAKDDGGDVREVIFLEIKTQSSRLSAHQRKIRDAVLDGRVSWRTLQIGADTIENR